jgi:hypothetical protein
MRSSRTASQSPTVINVGAAIPWMSESIQPMNPASNVQEILQLVGVR